MKKDKYGYRYSTDDLPKIKNIFLYGWACFCKILMFLLFGTGSVLLVCLVFPLMKLVFHPAQKFRKYARALVSATFRFFIGCMIVLGVMRMQVDDRKKYRQLHGKVVVANHPSLLDVVFLISLIPNADCIANAQLKKTILLGMIRQLYTVNDEGWEKLLIDCKRSLDEGNCMIIFPEGTRTPRHGTNPYKRGAARIAWETGAAVQPVYIGGNDKYGLGKHDAFFAYNRTERYLYDIHMLPQINIADFAELGPQHGSRAITKKMHDEISAEAYLRDYKIV